MKKPIVDFIGIGSGKSGSTWLFENIRKHPNVCDRNAKELNYFSRAYLYNKRDFEWYKSQFSECPAGMIKGEFSVIYMYDLKSAEMIQSVLPNVKILVMLRSPVERIYSDYFHSIRKAEIPASMKFSEYIRLPEKLEFAEYARYLRPYFDLFDRSRIHVEFLERASRDPRRVVADVYRFLELDASYLPEGIGDTVNQAVFYRWLFVENVMTRVSKWMYMRGYTKALERLKRLGVARMIRRINEAHRSKPPMPHSDFSYLMDHFAPFNEELINLLGLDLDEIGWERQQVLERLMAQ